MTRIFSVVAILLTSCAAVGTKTLYKSQSRPEILKIGIADVYKKDELSDIFLDTNEKFKESIQLFAKEKGSYQIVLLNTEMDYENPNKELIVDKCNLYNIDALVISRLKFI